MRVVVVAAEGRPVPLAVQHLRRRPPGLHAGVEVDDPLRQPPDRGRVVGHQDGGEVVPGRDPGQEVEELPAPARVHPRGGLVEEEEGGLVHERAGQEGALQLAPGELSEHGVEQPLAAHPGECRPRRLAVGGRDANRPGPAPVRHDHVHHPRREGPVEGLGLRQVADRATGCPGAGAEHLDLAGGERHQAERGLHERRLAAAVRAAQARELASGHVEAHVVQEPPPADLDGDAARGEGGRHRSASSIARAIPRTRSS